MRRLLEKRVKYGRIVIILSSCWLAFNALTGPPPDSLVSPDDGRLNEANFSRILIGTPKKDVVRLIGEPKDIRNADTSFPAVRYFPGIIAASVWKSDKTRIMIIYDDQGRVAWKAIDRAKVAGRE